jgi:trypsin-like peptidase
MLASGIVVLVATGGPTPEVSIAGTCFAYRDRNTFLTAAHCVPEGEHSVFVKFQHEALTRQVVSVNRHPRLDLAVLRAEPQSDEIAPHQFYEAMDTGALILGADFYGYGYPVEGALMEVTPRYFRGFIQRYFRYEPPSGNAYLAAEMSIPAPGGFSGGALCHVGSNRPFAVVTGNYESGVIVDSHEEVQQGRVVRREVIKRMITYGLAVILPAQDPWLVDQLGVTSE